MKLLWKQFVVAILAIGVLGGANADKKADIKPLLSEKFSTFIKNGNGDVCGFLKEIAESLEVLPCPDSACTNTVQSAQACLEIIGQEAYDKWGPILELILSQQCPINCKAASCSTDFTKLSCQALCCATHYLDSANPCCSTSSSSETSPAAK